MRIRPARQASLHVTARISTLTSLRAPPAVRQRFSSIGREPVRDNRQPRAGNHQPPRRAHLGGHFAWGRSVRSTSKSPLLTFADADPDSHERAAKAPPQLLLQPSAQHSIEFVRRRCGIHDDAGNPATQTRQSSARDDLGGHEGLPYVGQGAEAALRPLGALGHARHQPGDRRSRVRPSTPLTQFLQALDGLSHGYDRTDSPDRTVRSRSNPGTSPRFLLITEYEFPPLT